MRRRANERIRDIQAVAYRNTFHDPADPGIPSVEKAQPSGNPAQLTPHRSRHPVCMEERKWHALTLARFFAIIAYMIGKAISLKLSTDTAQAGALMDLAVAFAKACNALVPIVVANRCWNRVALHHLGYHPTRTAVPELGSQMVCQAVRRVADAYKVVKPRKGEYVKAVTFKPTSVNYDCRTHWIKGDKASLYTLSGRIVVDIQMGKRQRDIINQGKLKESKLVKRNGVWYLNAFVELPAVPPKEGGGTMGVDVGENNLAATSTGKIFGGGELRHKRDMHLACRKRLQANGSRAAKRKLKAIAALSRRGT